MRRPTFAAYCVVGGVLRPRRDVNKIANCRCEVLRSGHPSTFALTQSQLLANWAVSSAVEHPGSKACVHALRYSAPIVD